MPTMRSTFIAVGVLVFAIPAVVSSQSFLFTTIGEGSGSCGWWTNSRQADPAGVTRESSWVLGYVTAASLYRKVDTPNFAHGLDSPAVDHWVDNYCAAHPLENIQSAAAALVEKLKSRAM